MGRAGPDIWGRVIRDPYTMLLGAAAVLQAALVSSSSELIHPAWAIVALTGFAVVCVVAVIGRVHRNALLRAAAPFGLLLVAACWRAGDTPDLAGFGGLCVIAVVWLGCYGTRRQVWAAVVGSVLAVLLAPLLVGEPIIGDDARRAALTGAIALLVGPTIRTLVERGLQSAQLVTALEPASSQLEAVLRAATGYLVIACDVEGVITEFNQGAERLLGYRAAEVIGSRTPLLFHDRAEVAARAAELGVEPGMQVLVHDAGGDGADARMRDWTYVAKDGRRITVSLAMSCVRNAAGAITGFVGIGTDVTASRTTMQTLATQRELYQLLVENLPYTTVGLLDAQLRCITIGGHWLHRIGAEPASFRGRPVETFFDATDRPTIREFYTRALAEPMARLWDQDGRTYEIVAIPIAGGDGQSLVLTLTRDITERRQQEREHQDMTKALAMSEASFREAFEGAPIGMALLSVQDGAEDTFLQVNPAFAGILGFRPEDLVGTRVADVTHPEDLALVPDLSGNSERVLRKRFIRPSGRAVWVEVNYAIVRDADGRPSHVIEQIQDIHAIKESERALLDALEQQRAATARLRELDRIRTELVGTISHELRTPLTSIHGYLELLGEEELSTAQHSMVGVAMRNTERLGDLVDNLLVLVRLDSVDVPAGTDEVDIGGAVSAAIDTVRPEYVERGQHLEVNLPIERALVRGDFDQLDRVLVNLLSNASKYTPSGGRIAVDVAVIDAQVRIAVTDTGIGIPAEELPSMFTRFFRASTARDSAISGNGLGLAIVKSIVERHGGQVQVESEAGHGSTFTVTLPAAGAGPRSTARTGADSLRA